MKIRPLFLLERSTKLSRCCNRGCSIGAIIRKLKRVSNKPLLHRGHLRHAPQSSRAEVMRRRKISKLLHSKATIFTHPLVLLNRRHWNWQRFFFSSSVKLDSPEVRFGCPACSYLSKTTVPAYLSPFKPACERIKNAVGEKFSMIP
jgi:hypothetical protein